MFDYFKKKLGKKKPEVKAEPKTKKVEKTAKEIATEKGEPYVAVLGMDVDYNNLANGSFELDWNDKFVGNLIRAGYQGKTDADIVDLWFQNICRNVVMETYEQEQAIKNSGIYVNTRDIGGGRSEIG
jgi:DNA polymerase II small subunit/DNA polymerase delta subunit B